MSYRSDHDAALMRVDALESELAIMRKEQPAPAPPKPRVALRVAMAVVVCGTALAVGRVIGSGHESAPPATTTTALAADVRAELRACGGVAVKLDPTCRALIDGLATDVYADPDLRAAVGAWGEADREIASADPHDRPTWESALAHRASALQQIAPLL